MKYYYVGTPSLYAYAFLELHVVDVYCNIDQILCARVFPSDEISYANVYRENLYCMYIIIIVMCR